MRERRGGKEGGREGGGERREIDWGVWGAGGRGEGGGGAELVYDFTRVRSYTLIKVISLATPKSNT